jgi:hypothetical protein
MFLSSQFHSPERGWGREFGRNQGCFCDRFGFFMTDLACCDPGDLDIVFIYFNCAPVEGYLLQIAWWRAGPAEGLDRSGDSP